eukprot:3778995-Pleurochrysis_carterae.AAC.1
MRAANERKSKESRKGCVDAVRIEAGQYCGKPESVEGMKVQGVEGRTGEDASRAGQTRTRRGQRVRIAVAADSAEREAAHTHQKLRGIVAVQSNICDSML